MNSRLSALVVLAMALPVWAQPTTPQRGNPARSGDPGPKSETVKAFDRYVAAAEQRLQAEQGSAASFLRNTDDARLRRGEVLVDKVGQTPQDVPGGMVHDWIGSAFVPGATVARVLALVQDYDSTARYYQPDVQASRLMSRRGDDFHVFMRLRKHKVVTVLLDTEYDVHYGQLDPQHWFSVSRSTRITETDGGDHGFLWRLNSYWRFVEVEGGVIVQCEAISLTRDIPTGLGWMVGPFVTKIPRESLEFTMQRTRHAVEEMAKTKGPSTRAKALARDDIVVRAGGIHE